MAMGKIFKAKRKQANKKRRRAKRNRVNTLVVRAPSVVPDQLFTKMKYRVNVNPAEPNGGFTVNILRGNSIFASVFGAGGQPMGRDEWQNFYSQYQVMGSKIKVQYLPRPTQGNNYNVCLVPTLDPSPTTIQQLQESPYAKSSMCSRIGDHPRTINSYMKSAAIFGIKDILTEEDSAAGMAANPEKEWYWVIGTENNNIATTGAKDLDLFVEIEYYVRLFDRKQLEQS